jgi:hypothetical protein
VPGVKASLAAGLAATALAACGSGSAAPSQETLPVPTLPGVTKPTLVVGAQYPVTVGGVRFRPRERVTVTLSSARVRSTRTVVATRLGRFAASFDVRLGRCESALVKAVGRQGSRAQAEVVRPLCVEP